MKTFQIIKNFLITFLIFIFIGTISCLLCHAKIKLNIFKEPENPEIKRIVLVIIDTLRADHLGCYGYPRNTSPFIDSLAKKGILIKKALATAPITAPSHTSIFTSLYPLQHKITRNEGRLSEESITVTEILKNLGYKTAAFLSVKGVFESMRITQGFDFVSEAILPGIEWQQTGDKTIESAIKWLNDQNTEDKHFIFLHIYDPHAPYNSPEKFYKPFIENSKESFVNFLLNTHKTDFDFFDRDLKQMLDMINAYDGEISFADSLVKLFYNYYEIKGFNSDTLWIITSDHGEGMGNHKWRAHGKQVYNTQLHVPLIFNFSSGLHKGKVIDKDIVESVDIFPTIIELARGNINKIKEKQPVEGISLVSLFNKDHNKERLAFAQRRSYDSKNKPDIIIPETTNYEDGERYSIQSKRYKYIYFSEGKDEFYDLKKDPYEVNNLIGKGIKEEIKLKEILLNKIKYLKETSLSDQVLNTNQQI
ncbi:MAG: sulfatase [Candidatus Melainabacteria bacterium]|nr:sulfatase [Candidatus Melainabacteria bacterium]